MKKKNILYIVGIIFIFCIAAVSIYEILPFTIKAKENGNLTAEAPTEEQTEAPHYFNVTLNQASYEIAYGETFDVSQVDVTVEADDEITMQFEDGNTSITFDSTGEITEQLTISDNYHNAQTVEITISVIDTEAPVIKGVTDCKIEEGHKFNALGGVTAIDNADGNVSGTLTCTPYDINAVGTQKLTITASDKSGNIASVDFNLVVIATYVPEVEDVPDVNDELLALLAANPYRKVVPYDGKARSVTCWGDSLTQGTGATEVTVGEFTKPTVITESVALAKFAGITVYNMGIISEDSRTIACRQGGLKMYVSNITIPATGSVSFDTIMCEDGNEIQPCRTNYQAQKDCFDACTIAFGEEKIVGRLTYSSGQYTFTRAEAGKELVINGEAQIITPTSTARKDDILILEMGNNGGWDDDYQVLINQYISMLAYSNCQYYLIIGDTDGSEGDRGDWDVALKTAFGDHFIGMREYLAANGMSDCGLEPSEYDQEMMDEISVPYALKSDWSHLNSYGYYSKGKAIYERGKELGYWN